MSTSRLTSLHIGWTSSRSMRESRQRYSETMLRGARVSRGGIATDCPPWADGWKELLSASATAGRSHGNHLSETREASPRYQPRMPIFIAPMGSGLHQSLSASEHQ